MAERRSINGTVSWRCGEGDLEPKEVADLAEESVPRTPEVLKPEFPRLFERRAVPKIDQRARHRSIAEKPVSREFVGGVPHVEYAIYEYRIPVAITER